MLYREIIAVRSQIYTKHINSPCGQNVEFVNVELAGACNKESAWQVRHWIYSANKTNDTEPELHFSVMGITSWVPQSITVQSSQLLVRVRAPLLARCGLCQATQTPSPCYNRAGDETTNDQWRRASAVEPTVPAESRQKNSRRANSVEREQPQPNSDKNIAKRGGE